jgi:predicted transcriptional regulator
MPNAQSNLFTTPDTEDAPAKMSDRDLLRDVSAAADILAMGSEGIAVHTALRLRGELLAALEALRQRWHMESA